MKSASAMLLNKTHREIWLRGEEYVSKGLVRILRADEDAVVAEAKGTQIYEISVKFAPKGISPKCNCPYFTKNGRICKHIVAAAIVWDEERGITRPSSEAMEQSSVAPPKLSSSDIKILFKKPLEADLDQVRILAEETALRGYVRPHARLPQIPKIERDVNQTLTLTEIKRCFSEIKKWSRRKTFDPYFCSGEMVAAFCEMLRITRQRLKVTPPPVAVDILLTCQEFNRLLVTELIDDSQGLHVISEAHLDDIYQHLQESSTGSNGDSDSSKLLDKYVQQRNQY